MRALTLDFHWDFFFYFQFFDLKTIFVLMVGTSVELVSSTQCIYRDKDRKREQIYRDKERMFDEYWKRHALIV